MNEFIQFEYSVWLILPAILLGIGFGVALYYKERDIGSYHPVLPPVLGSLRALTVALLAILLIGPFLSYVISEQKDPVLVIAQDASRSIEETTPDSLLEEVRQTLAGLSEASDGWTVDYYSFGESVRPDLVDSFPDRRTDFSELFKHIRAQYDQKQLGVVVLATDGILNSGQNPVYYEDRFAAPLYILPLGDTSSRKDISIEKIFHNRIAYLDDRFKVEVDIRGQFARGLRTGLRLQKISEGKARTLEQRELRFEHNDELKTLEFTLDARPAGWNHYRLSVETAEGEQTPANNVKDFYVEVLEAEQRLHIVAAAAHPDLTALKQSLEGNKNYRVKTSFVDAFSEPKPAPDLFIMHQIPFIKGGASRQWLNYAEEENIPVFYITGSQSDLRQLNRAQGILQITGTNRQTNDVIPVYNSAFSFFQPEDEKARAFRQFPPLWAPYGEYNADPRAQVLFRQQIGKVETEYPLLLMGPDGDRRTALLTGEGFWRWRLFDYLQHGDHKRTDDLLNSVVQYLTTTEDKRRFRVYSSDQMYGENEKVSFEAELYNASYELTTEPEVPLVIEDEKGNTYDYTFRRDADYYTLDAGLFPEGAYRFTARTELGGDSFTAGGQFTVRPLQVEMYNLQADHRFLRRLVDRYGGELIDPARVTSVTDLLRANDRLKPVLYSSSRTSLLLDLPWMIALLILLLTAEWFLRRWAGSY